MTTKTLNIYQRIAQAMEKVTYIQKDKKGGLQYAIVSHDVVTAKVRPVLLEAGVVYHPHELDYVQNGNRTEMWGSVIFVNIDKPEDRIVVPSIGFGIDSQDKGCGKAESYLVKYAVLKMMGLETGEDPDNDQTTEHVPDAPAFITKEQAEDLNFIADDVGADKAKFCQYLKVGSLTEIPADQFHRAYAALEKKRAA
tara:strand:- start:863 stop:1450 length:588 start_codon:yes stop_codon:yes gene_type:complete